MFDLGAGGVRVGETAVVAAGMQLNVGHGLNVVNVPPVIAGMDGVAELHIGHSIVARAVFIGLRAAVREMKDVIEKSAGA